ncbi:segregation and condensation protein A [Fibrobacterota bacterium]
MGEENKYEVKLDLFEGPLDLLVYLVQKNELDPRDIPIALITDQYLEYIENIGINNLSQAGEFLVMASRLMLLKAHEMLPSEEQDEIEDMEYDLDKEALIQQMLEHQKFKEAAKYIKHLESRNFGTFHRGIKDKPDQREAVPEEQTFEAGIYELLMAFSKAIESSRSVLTHQVEIDDVTIENQMKRIQNMLLQDPHFQFEDIFKQDPRNLVIVVSFMAILELGKLNEIHTQQFGLFAPIWIYGERRSFQRIQETKPVDMEIIEQDEFKPGLAKLIKQRVLEQKQENELERILGEMEFLQNTELEGELRQLINTP